MDLVRYKKTIKKGTCGAEKVGSEMFTLYGTLLSKEKHLQWEGQVKEMTNSNPWVDLQVKAQVGKCR